MINYLARLGWSHGDDEIFSREQFLDWFNLDHLGKSAAQFDEAKLRWVNAQHLKAMAPERLAELVRPRLAQRGIAPDPQLAAICALFKDRCDTTVALADWAAVFYSDVNVDPEVLQPMLNPEVHQAIAALAQALASCEWTPTVVAAQIKQVLTQAGIKMPQLAMPVRVLLCGQAQTPSLDAVISLFTRERVLQRLQKVHNFGL
jgi:glutamyl-tRNA synthetase